MTDNRTTELLPCPFCGGKAHIIKDGIPYVIVECECCFCRTNCNVTEAEAIAAWNTRAELGSGTCEPKWTLQGETQTQEFWRCECGNCGECFGVESRESFPLKMTVGKVDIPNYCPNCGKRVSA